MIPEAPALAAAMKKGKNNPWWWAADEEALPLKPETIRQEGGREVKVYPRRYADGYEGQKNVRPKSLM
jgi:hypothetical protein